MSKVESGQVQITLGGQRYTFMWGTKAIREIQELMSTPEVPATPTSPAKQGHLVSPEEIFAELKRGRLKYVCAFIWAGLQKFHPGVSLDDADDILDHSTKDEINRLLAEFGLGITPAPEDIKELTAGVKPNPRKARATRGTGGSSSSKPALLV